MNKFIIYPPPGKEFRECVLCKNPYIWDEKWNNDKCLWCEIHKEEKKDE